MVIKYGGGVRIWSSGHTVWGRGQELVQGAQSMGSGSGADPGVIQHGGGVRSWSRGHAAWGRGQEPVQGSHNAGLGLGAGLGGTE